MWVVRKNCRDFFGVKDFGKDFLPFLCRDKRDYFGLRSGPSGPLNFLWLVFLFASLLFGGMFISRVTFAPACVTGQVRSLVDNVNELSENKMAVA